jgi:hypothetical protein
MAKPLLPNGNLSTSRAGPPVPPPATASQEVDGKRPVHEFRHRNVRATIWRNETDKGPMFNVTLSRIYRDGEQWKDSHSFGYDDLMNLAKLLADSHTYISTLRENDYAAGRPTRGSQTEKRSKEERRSNR